MEIDFVRYKTYVLSIISYPFLRIHPNILTLFSLFFSVLFFYFLNNQLYIAALVSLFGAVFDAIDGYVARTTGKVSAFGGFFDSVTDRISDFLIIAAFGYAQLVSWEIIAPAILTTFLVSYARARAEATKKGEKMDSGIFQRTGRFLVIVGGLAAYILLSETAGILLGMCIVLVVLNMITIVQRIYAVYSTKG